MVDYNRLAGAFGSVVENAAVVEGRSAAASQLGDFGLPQELNPFAPAPTDPPTIGQPQNPANISQTDAARGAQPVSGLKAIWQQYKKVILIGAAVVLGFVLLIKRRKK